MKTLLSVASDLLVNLSAGWFGAAFILPMTTKKFQVNWRLLMINILCGILALLAAVLFRNS